MSDDTGRPKPSGAKFEKVKGPTTPPDDEPDDQTRKEIADQAKGRKPTPSDRYAETVSELVQSLREEKAQHQDDCRRLQAALDLIRPRYAALLQAASHAKANGTLSNLLMIVGSIFVSIASLVPEAYHGLLAGGGTAAVVIGAILPWARPKGEWPPQGGTPDDPIRPARGD